MWQCWELRMLKTPAYHRASLEALEMTYALILMEASWALDSGSNP